METDGVPESFGVMLQSYEMTSHNKQSRLCGHACPYMLHIYSRSNHMFGIIPDGGLEQGTDEFIDGVNRPAVLDINSLANRIASRDARQWHTIHRANCPLVILVYPMEAR